MNCSHEDAAQCCDDAGSTDTLLKALLEKHLSDRQQLVLERGMRVAQIVVDRERPR